jgi:hypothetical protein
MKQSLGGCIVLLVVVFFDRCSGVKNEVGFQLNGRDGAAVMIIQMYRDV